ncbi:MAG: hypothetical protein J3Q66DRAFT_393121 [Benniella sp.]|nr:MAG: hypothetical protein J3Q66DRAFT_393121 [Benniella sp.]
MRFFRSLTSVSSMLCADFLQGSLPPRKGDAHFHGGSNGGHLQGARNSALQVKLEFKIATVHHRDCQKPSWICTDSTSRFWRAKLSPSWTLPGKSIGKWSRQPKITWQRGTPYKRNVS